MIRKEFGEQKKSVRERGLEPPPGYPDQALNLARLPIPPFPQILLL